MDGSDASSVFTSSGSVDFREHNVWTPMLELLFNVQVGGSIEVFFEEIDLARLTLSCHFALDLPCDKADAHGSV